MYNQSMGRVGTVPECVMNNHSPPSCDYELEPSFYSSSGIMELGQNKKGPEYIAKCSHFRERLYAAGTVYSLVMDTNLFDPSPHSKCCIAKTRVHLWFTIDA